MSRPRRARAAALLRRRLARATVLLRRRPAHATALLIGLVMLTAPAAAAQPHPQAPASPAPPTAATPTPAPAPAPLAPAPIHPYPGYAANPYAGYATDAAPPQPTIVGSGADSLIRGPDLRGANAPTLLERYGGQGYSLDTALSPGAGTDAALNAIAGGIFSVATWLGRAVLALVQWAFSLALFHFVGDAVTAIVGALQQTLYLPFVQVAVISAGLYALWHGLIRKRATVAAESLAWTVGALVVAALFFAQPRAIIDGANAFSTGLSRAVLAGVSVADPKSGPDDGVTAAPTFAGHPADTELRVAADRFWRVFVYQPWLVLEFGDPAAGRPFGERLLTAKTVTEQDYAAAADDPEALAALLAAKRQQYQQLQQEVLADPRVAEWFRGRRAVERVGVATLALTGVTIGGVLMALVAAAVLIAQLALLLVVLLAPVALLVGVHPGAGRVLALRWAQLAVGLLVKRVALAALLAVVLVIDGVLLDATYPLGWLVVMGLQILVVGAAVAYRRPLLGLMGPTTVPVALGPLRAPSAAGRTTLVERAERGRGGEKYSAGRDRRLWPHRASGRGDQPVAPPARPLAPVPAPNPRDLGLRWQRRRLDLGLGTSLDRGLAPGADSGGAAHGNGHVPDSDGGAAHGNGHGPDSDGGAAHGNGRHPGGDGGNGP